MIKILEFLWHGCWHNWKYENNSKIMNEHNIQIGFGFWYKCEKCGRYKIIRME